MSYTSLCISLLHAASCDRLNICLRLNVTKNIRAGTKSQQYSVDLVFALLVPVQGYNCHPRAYKILINAGADPRFFVGGGGKSRNR